MAPNVDEAVLLMAARYPSSARQIRWALEQLAAFSYLQDNHPETFASDEFSVRIAEHLVTGRALPLAQVMDPGTCQAYLRMATAGFLRQRGVGAESQRTVATRAWVLRTAAELLGSDMDVHVGGSSQRVLDARALVDLLHRAASASDAVPLSPALARAALVVHVAAAAGLDSGEMVQIRVPEQDSGLVTPERISPAPAGLPEPGSHLLLGPSGRRVLRRWLEVRSVFTQGRGGTSHLFLSMKGYRGPEHPMPPGLPVTAQALARGHTWLVNHLNTHQDLTGYGLLPGRLQRVATATRDVGHPILY
jgi:hypothetical protein